MALVIGANKIGAVCMPVNWRLAPPEIDYIVDNGKAKLMMADAAFPYGKIQTFKTEEFSSWYGKFEAKDPGHTPDLDDTALQLYSSGTTGLPKGVELSHRNLKASMVDATPLAIAYQGPPDVMLNALPTYHIAGVGVALLTASKGGMSVLYPDFDPAKVVAAIAEHRITHSFLVPAMIQFMLQVPGADQADYSSLRVHLLRRLADLREGADRGDAHLQVPVRAGLRPDRNHRRGDLPAAGGPRPGGTEEGPAALGGQADGRGRAARRGRRRARLRRGRGRRGLDPHRAEHERLLGERQSHRRRLCGGTGSGPATPAT